MSSQNISGKITEFIIAGFDTTSHPALVGVVILIVYIVVILANAVNVLIIVHEQKLHRPMYLLVCNLAAVDVLYTSSVCPTMIGVLVTGVKTISYASCLIQMFTFHLGEVMEALALSVMAFDRLIAVSCPFHYHTYLTNVRIVLLTYLLWIVGSGLVAGFPVTVIPLPHCYKVLKYTFCTFPTILRTTCVDPNYYFNLVAILTFLFIFLTLGFICLSYIGIIVFAKLSSTNDRVKMGSTCLSHLIVVVCYYIPIIVIALLTRLGVVLTLEARDGLNVSSMFISALVNPFVYCLRTKEIKNEIIMVFKKV